MEIEFKDDVSKPHWCLQVLLNGRVIGEIRRPSNYFRLYLNAPLQNDDRMLTQMLDSSKERAKEIINQINDFAKKYLL